MKTIITFFINSNIWVAFCVLGLAASSEALLGINDFKISQFVFFSTIFAYNFQRIVRIKKGYEHSYKSWLEKNIKASYFLMLIAASVSLFLFLHFKLSTQIAILFTGALSLFYPFWIREIPFVKIFVIYYVFICSSIVSLCFTQTINILFKFVTY